ncbi:MAG: FtsQ-type POTRA domain-containing protein [Clostridium sp.]|nr:FtsQ-type POTRA domain-containing protein [Clostridium sp.]
MAKTDNEYIRKAKKRRKIKKVIIFTILIIICAFIIVTYTDIFKIKNIKCSEDNIITKDFVIEKSKELEGKNLLFLTKDEVKNTFKENPYVEEVKYKKKYPSTIELSVIEKKGLFFVRSENEFNVISDEMTYLEKANNIDGRNLIEVIGIDLSGKTLGEYVGKSDREKEILKDIYKVQQFLNENLKNVKISSINISNLSNILCYFDNIQVMLGSDENLINKMKTAAIVYNQGAVQEYINVSFNGSADFK